AILPVTAYSALIGPDAASITSTAVPAGASSSTVCSAPQPVQSSIAPASAAAAMFFVFIGSPPCCAVTCSRPRSGGRAAHHAALGPRIGLIRGDQIDLRGLGGLLRGGQRVLRVRIGHLRD